MTTVLICDDHRLVREALRHFVSQVPGVDRVELAGSGEEAVARFRCEPADLVLMDLAMPGLGGLAATRVLVRDYQACVLVLTGSRVREDLAGAIASGARGFLNKDVSHEQLCAAVTGALSGADLLVPGLRRSLEAAPACEGPALTQREIEVLRGMSRGLSNAAIGRELYLSEDTIKTHARRLFRKLGVGDRAQAVALGFRRGLVR